MDRQQIQFLFCLNPRRNGEAQAERKHRWVQKGHCDPFQCPYLPWWLGVHPKSSFDQRPQVGLSTCSDHGWDRSGMSLWGAIDPNNASLCSCLLFLVHIDCDFLQHKAF